MKTIRRNLNPATVLATAALFVALGTGAASALPGKGSVDRNDIRANAVASKQVTNGAISGLDVADGAITGADVDESTLGKVQAAAGADRATSAESAANASRVGGLTVTAHTGIVRLPTFASGQNQCKSVMVDVPGADFNDHVLMTSQGIPTYAGEDQVSLEVHAVGSGQVEVQGCLSADAATPVNPTPSGYVFLVFEKK